MCFEVFNFNILYLPSDEFRLIFSFVLFWVVFLFCFLIFTDVTRRHISNGCILFWKSTFPVPEVQDLIAVSDEIAHQVLGDASTCCWSLTVSGRWSWTSLIRDQFDPGPVWFGTSLIQDQFDLGSISVRLFPSCDTHTLTRTLPSFYAVFVLMG